MRGKLRRSLNLQWPIRKEGIAQIEAATGVRDQVEGAHPGWGTRHALIALGPRVYLEIVPRDSEQANPSSPQSPRLSETRSSRLVAWALRAALSCADFRPLLNDGFARPAFVRIKRVDGLHNLGCFST